jgi:hypothetical protein
MRYASTRPPPTLLAAWHHRLAGASVLLCGGAALAQPCEPHWRHPIGQPGMELGFTVGIVNAVAVFDGGTGPDLYAGGIFWMAGGQSAVNIAKWNGSSWSSLNVPSERFMDLLVFDDGTGSALYAAGSSLPPLGGLVSKYNGSSWSGLGSGIGGPVSRVNALVVFNDGTGAALYAGGYFPTAGGQPANNIA